MGTWTLPRSATTAEILVELASEHGVPAARCLHGTGIAAETLADPHGEVTGDQELLLIDNLVREAGHVPGLGLKAGERYHLTTLDIWGFAMISSRTLREAARIGLRYLELTYAFSRITLEEEGDRAMLRFDLGSVPARLRRFLLEREAAAVLTITRELFGTGIPLERVETTLSEPADVALEERVYGVTPCYAEARDAAIFDARLLDLPLPRASERTARLAEEQCRQLLAARRARLGVGGQVRARLVARGGHATIEEVARDLLVSPRTLRRRLVGEDTGFRQLADEVREGLAEELLATRALTIEQIADRLGYSEPAAFTRAFRRWKGVPPSAY